MKVLMAPFNFSGQPMALIKELRNRGVKADFLEYNPHKFGYDSDRTIRFVKKNRVDVQIKTLKDVIKEDYDIYHFWFRSLFFWGNYQGFTGLDLPFLKSRGKKVIYRFTGNDLRYTSAHLKVDPYSCFKHGFENPINENRQRQYINFLKHYVDKFVVQDPEMNGYMPEASIIPRAIDLANWPNVGINKTKRPLVIHAPSIPEIKGSKYIRKAVKSLKAEGLDFGYKEIINVPHKEAVEWYKKADIVVDQLLIGWYGVLTMEAMALGKPVLVYIRKELQQQHPDLPFEPVHLNNFQNKLRLLIQNQSLRQKYSDKGRNFVERVHDVNKVATKLLDLYKNVLSRESSVSGNNFNDIDYFVNQFKLMNEQADYEKWKANKFPEVFEELQRMKAQNARLQQENQRLKN